MLVETPMLQAGYIVKKDVFAKAVDPLIAAGTELTERHIEFLKAFQIEKIEVESHLSNGQRVNAKKADKSRDVQSNRATIKEIAPETTDEKYRWAVSHYTQFFKNWQAGTALDISSFRKVMLPMLIDALNDPKWLAQFLLGTLPCRSRSDRSVTLGLLSAFLAKKMKEPQGDVYQIGLIGMLADSGLAKLAPSLLDREGNFIGHEESLYERHVADSYNMIKNVPAFREEFIIALTQHHEYEDGSGYPLHLTGNQINTFGKYLIACANLLNQLVKIKIPGAIIPALDWLSINEFQRLPRVVFKKLETELMTLFIGTDVKLSNGQSGRITFVMADSPTRPMVSLANNQVIALSMNRSIKIISTL